MTLNIVYRSSVPGRPYANDLFCLPADAVPYVLGALRLRMYPYFYTTEEDYVRGRSALAEFGGGLLMPCALEITNRQDALYNLLDATLNGNERSVTGEGTYAEPYVYTPAIPQVVEAAAISAPSLRSDTRSAKNLLDNFVTGALSADAPAPALANVNLDAIRAAVEEIASKNGVTFEQAAQIIAILGA